MPQNSMLNCFQFLSQVVSGQYDSKDIHSNISAHLRQQREQWGDVLDDMPHLWYIKTPVYSKKKMLQYAVVHRYFTFQACELMEESKLPWLFRREKVTAGMIDTIISGRECYRIADVYLKTSFQCLMKCSWINATNMQGRFICCRWNWIIVQKGPWAYDHWPG